MSCANAGSNNEVYLMEIENKTSKIVLVDVGLLKPHPKNPNKHPADQIKRLAEILQFQGWRAPIVVSNQSGFIVAGHGRLMAAQSLGLKKVPVQYQDFDDESQEFSHMSADNSIAAWAEMDLSVIHKELIELEPFSIEMLGFKNFQFESKDASRSKIELKINHLLEIKLKDESEQQKLYDELRKRGYEVRILS